MEADANADNYEITLASDPLFLEILETTIVESNFYKSDLLMPNATYYWRVKAINDCGESALSEADFTTVVLDCEILNQLMSLFQWMTLILL